jgi:hypothetical protein
MTNVSNCMSDKTWLWTWLCHRETPVNQNISKLYWWWSVAGIWWRWELPTDSDFCHQGGTRKLLNDINTVETYWHDHSLENSFGTVSDVTNSLSNQPFSWKMHFRNISTKFGPYLIKCPFLIQWSDSGKRCMTVFPKAIITELSGCSNEQYICPKDGSTGRGTNYVIAAVSWRNVARPSFMM